MTSIEIANDTLCGVYIDMGTTNTRVWLMRGREIATFACAQVGVGDSAREKSREKIFAALKRLISDVRKAQDHLEPTFCIAAGMITSALGLAEIPHLLAPVGEAELSNAMRRFHFSEVTDLLFLLVPGVRSGDPSDIRAPIPIDLMRGEETLCIGLLKNGILKADSTLLNLGSHWKVISLDAQSRISASLSSLSGELLQAAQTQTILASSVPQTWPKQFDPKWVEAGTVEQRRSGLSRALYCVRLLQQSANANAEDCFAFLCGAFIGADLDKLIARRILKPGSPVIVSASRPLGFAWQHVLAKASIDSRLLTDAERESGLLTGLHALARFMIAHGSQATSVTAR